MKSESMMFLWRCVPGAFGVFETCFSKELFSPELFLLVEDFIRALIG